MLNNQSVNNDNQLHKQMFVRRQIPAAIQLMRKIFVALTIYVKVFFVLGEATLDCEEKG